MSDSKIITFPTQIETPQNTLTLTQDQVEQFIMALQMKLQQTIIFAERARICLAAMLHKHGPTDVTEGFLQEMQSRDVDLQEVTDEQGNKTLRLVLREEGQDAGATA